MDPQYDIRESEAADIRLRRRMHAKLHGVQIRKSDDDGVATVTITGTGHIVDLQISEDAKRHPTRLGQQLTTAVIRARRTADALAERYRDAKLPGTSSPTEIAAALPQPSAEIDVSALGWADTAEAKRSLVAAFEAFNQVLRAREQFKAKWIKQEIGSAAGSVEINAANTRMRITISIDAPQNLGLERLSRQTLNAIREAENSAALVRQRTLDQISVADISIGERIRRIEERIRGGT